MTDDGVSDFGRGGASPVLLVGLAGLGSAALLLAALGFQYLGGLAPCALCIWQRWPHLAAILLGAAGLRVRHCAIAALGALSASGSAAVAAFHLGVEQGWWQGLAACARGFDVTELAAEDAYLAIMDATVVACDEVAWSFAGLSMAAWNMGISIALSAAWGLAFLKLRAAARGAHTEA